MAASGQNFSQASSRYNGGRVLPAVVFCLVRTADYLCVMDANRYV